jgi:cysteine-rich repeat protein
MIRILAVFLFSLAIACGDDATPPLADGGRDASFDATAPDDAGHTPDGGTDAGGPACGNGDLDPPEECDDGNLFPGDGCSPTCTREPICGNGDVEEGEGCDDGNRMPGDGCSATCSIEELCGNGRIDDGEDCDDGGREPGDGCDAACAREPRCGDTVLDPGEECDDGGLATDDGCDASCMIEPSTCGDGTLQRWAEECDDGNSDAGDGCDDMCRVEGTCDRPIDLATAGTAIPGGFRFIGRNVGALDNGSGACLSRLGGLDRVFVYTPDRNGRLTVTTNGAATTYDTVLHARTSCEELPTQIACDDSTGGGTAAQFSVEVSTGTPIYIFADAKVSVSGVMSVSATGTFQLDATLVSLAGEDEACDPSGVTIQCVTGLLCAPDGMGGNTCRSDADLGCGAGVPLVDLTPRISHGAVTVSGDTRTSTNRFAGSCGSSSHTAPEIVHRLVMPYDGRVGISVAPAGFADAVTYVRERCADSTSQRACADANTIPASTMGLIAAGTELFVVVDGYSSASFAYTLQLIFERDIAAGAECDPLSAGDRCATGTLCAPDGAIATCQAIDVGCGVGVPVVDLAPLVSPTGAIAYDGSTASSVNRTNGTCGGSGTGSPPENVHRLVMPYDAEVRFNIDPSWDEVFYVRADTCTGTQRFCSDPPTVAYSSLGLVPAGTVLYVFVDGWSSTASGPYPLRMQLRRRSIAGESCGAGPDDPTCAPGLACTVEGTGSFCRATICGDGTISGSEACDDGNDDSGDGCSSTCTVETIGMGSESCESPVRLNLVPSGAAALTARAAGTTAEATADLTGYCSATAGAPDVVYVFGLAETRDLTVTLTPTGFDAALYIRGGLMRACDDSTGEAYCRDGAASGAAETIRLSRVPAGTYYIVIDGVGTGASSRGAYTLAVTATTPPP